MQDTIMQDTMRQEWDVQHPEDKVAQSEAICQICGKKYSLCQICGKKYSQIKKYLKKYSQIGQDKKLQESGWFTCNECWNKDE